MAAKEVRPIRPTKVMFTNEMKYKDFVEYAVSSSKTKSVGMDKMRKMMKEFKNSIKS
ncbi:hypothetical protein [Paenibacillus xylanexedens]|uniref:hypothetical protein n=1 Tax=Paenibacillus xylanexedens TaxID=528191 RepID=UPI001642E8F0|nr:hypothetical protein [Paenibacillus xylanexedens]